MASLYTTVLTYPSSLVIQQSSNLTDISILAIGGSVNILGTSGFQGALPANAVIPSGTSQTFIFPASSPCEGLTITPASGASASITIQQ
jgi:hypothetical protein